MFLFNFCELVDSPNAEQLCTVLYCLGNVTTLDVVVNQYCLHLSCIMWRACCYFIILSVIFPDGNRSLLAFLSDLLAR